jgi:flagellar assembly factor FliW
MQAPVISPLPGHLTFADGLVGLPDLRTFTARSLDDAPFFVLDSLDDEAFGFVAADAETIRPGMSAELALAGSIEPGDRVLVLLALHGEPPAMTANLAGPLVVDAATGAARQLVLEGDAYPIQAPVTGAA